MSTPPREASSNTDPRLDFRRRTIIPPQRDTAIKSKFYKGFNFYNTIDIHYNWCQRHLETCQLTPTIHPIFEDDELFQFEESLPWSPIFIRGFHYILYRRTQTIVWTPFRDTSGDTDTQPYFRPPNILTPRRVTAIKSHVYKVFDLFIL